MIIAIAQSRVHSAPSDNAREICSLIEEAGRAGARLILFPEGALSGYAKAQIDDWCSVDWAGLEMAMDEVREAARKARVWVVLGSAHQLGSPFWPYNSLYVISDKGEIHARYDKRLLSAAELERWYTPGVAPLIFEVDGYRFGCALCIEVQFPQVFAEYEALDVDCVLFAAYDSNDMFWTQLQGHAACNNIWIAVSTPSCCSEGLPSGLIGPNGRALSRAVTGRDSTIVTAVLDRTDPYLRAALELARPWRRRAKQGDIYKPRARHRDDDRQSAS